MKIAAFPICLVLICAPGFAMALELSSQEALSTSANDRGSAPEMPASRSQNAAAASTDNFPIKLNALYPGSALIANHDPAGKIKQTSRTEGGIIDDWRDQMFKSISMYFGPPQRDPTQSNRLPAGNAPASRTSDGKIVMKLVLKETLKFTKERVVWINSLVNALKYEVSSDKFRKENSEAETKDTPAVERKSNDRKTQLRPAGSAVVKKKFIVKTGLRVRIDGGKLGLVSESEAGYGKASYFYKVNLDNQSNNSLGFRYVLGRSIYIQVERDFFRTMNPAAHDKPTINLLQLGCRF